jgi:hypothetical protein
MGSAGDAKRYVKGRPGVSSRSGYMRWPIALSALVMRERGFLVMLSGEGGIRCTLRRSVLLSAYAQVAVRELQLWCCSAGMLGLARGRARCLVSTVDTHKEDSGLKMGKS